MLVKVIYLMIISYRFRYLLFTPVPYNTNFGNRYKVRQWLRLNGLSPQATGVPVMQWKGLSVFDTQSWKNLSTIKEKVPYRDLGSDYYSIINQEKLREKRIARQKASLFRILCYMLMLNYIFRIAFSNLKTHNSKAIFYSLQRRHQLL